MRTQKVVSSFSSTSLILQLIKDPNPQTINQSKQHKLNQKSRPKSVNKQLISQKKKKKKTEAYPISRPKSASQYKVWSVAGVWEEETGL